MESSDRIRDELSVAYSLTVHALASTPSERSDHTIAAASHLIDAAHDALHQLVGDARDQGMSWTQIGQLLGISRQAAQKRFAEPPSSTGGRTDAEPPPVQIERALALMHAAASGDYSTLEEAASAHVLRLAGSAGFAPVFAHAESMLGSLQRRDRPTARMIGSVTVVTATEHRSHGPINAEVVLAADGTMLGFNYLPLDAD